MTIGPFRLLALTLCLSTVPALATAQVFSPQQRLDGSAAGRFATSLAVEGAIAVIGASDEAVNGAAAQGSVYVATRATGTWTLQQRLLASDGRANDHFGNAVAMAGNTIVVGADGGGTASNGAVYVFVWNGSSWVQQAKLVASDGASNTRFGFSVAIEGDTVAVGAPHTRWPDPIDSGAVYVFTRTGATFTEQKLLATSYRDLGRSVALSGDTLCVGAIRDGGTPGSFRGAAFLYERSGSTWTQQQIVTTDDPGIGARLGTSCAIEGDTLVVGAPGDSSTTPPGAAYVFSRTGSTWTFQQRLGYLDFFGRTVELVGNWLVVGAPRRNNPGAFYAFERVGGTWTERQRTQPNVGFGSDALGSALAFDGTTVTVGTPVLGSAYFYSRGATTGVPGAPTGVSATVSGNAVSLAWGAPTSGAAPTSYTLVVRTGAGQLVTTVPVGTARSLATTAPNGVYRVSVLASNASGAGPESTAVTITVPSGGAALPGAPTSLTASVVGNVVTFSWTPPNGGGATGYQLLAGTTPTFSTPIATLPLPASPNGATVGSVPAGTYWVRLRAINAAGLGPASNEIPVTVGGAQVAPLAPTLNAAAVAGRTVTLSWVPGGGGAATSYRMTAAATSGGTPLAVAIVNGTGATFQAVPAGTYFVRLTASNAAGTSGESNEIVIQVP